MRGRLLAVLVCTAHVCGAAPAESRGGTLTIPFGKTSAGRPRNAEFFTSRANLQRLDYFRQINRRLVLGKAGDAESDALVQEGKLIVCIAGAELPPDLLTADTPEAESVRENVILIHIASLDPDGTRLVAEDWRMLNLPETRDVAKLLFRDWYPELIFSADQALVNSAKLHNAEAVPALSVHSLAVAAQRRPDYLRAAYRKSHRAGDGSGYLVPFEQWDEPTSLELLDRLTAAGIDIHRAERDWVIPAAQPFGDYLETLPGLAEAMGVALTHTARLPGKTGEPATEFRAEGSVRGRGPIVTLDHREMASFIAAAFLLDRVEGVRWAADGTVMLDSLYSDGPARADNFARQFGVKVTLREEGECVPAFELKRPRTAIYGDDGWVSWVLDQYRVPYANVGGEDLRHLHERFDSVVLVADGPVSPPLAEFVRQGGTLIQLGSGPAAASTKAAVANPIAFGIRENFAFEQVREGKGQIIRFPFAPQFRGQTYRTFPLLLNAIYLASARRL